METSVQLSRLQGIVNLLNDGLNLINQAAQRPSEHHVNIDLINQTNELLIIAQINLKIAKDVAKNGGEYSPSITG